MAHSTCVTVMQQTFRMPAARTSRRVISEVTVQNRLDIVLNAAAVLRNQLAAEDPVADISDFRRRLASPSSACTGALYLSCGLRGTRAKHRAAEVHRLLVAGGGIGHISFIACAMLMPCFGLFIASSAQEPSRRVLQKFYWGATGLRGLHDNK